MTKIKNFLKYRCNNIYIRIMTILNRFTNKKKTKKIFILGVVTHKNYGDFAISEAEHQFLSDHFDCQIVEITEEEISNSLTFRLIDSMLSPQDIIFLHGGGNHGNIYTFHEGYRREAIKHFQNNRLIIFPQTYFFTDDENGKKESEISKKIYNSHPNLVFSLRDELSYGLAKEAYPNVNVIFCPDMVLYFMNKFKRTECDDSVMVLFRIGLESKFSDEEKQKVLDKLSEQYSLKYNNHTAQEDVTLMNRRRLIDAQVALYSQSSVVLTDKLHGAIFSILSGTPCVMVETFNHKLREVYKLFKDCEGYYFTGNLDEIPELIEKAKRVGTCVNPDLSGYYENLYRSIIEK